MKKIYILDKCFVDVTDAYVSSPLKLNSDHNVVYTFFKRLALHPQCGNQFFRLL